MAVTQIAAATALVVACVHQLGYALPPSARGVFLAFCLALFLAAGVLAIRLQAGARLVVVLATAGPALVLAFGGVQRPELVAALAAFGALLVSRTAQTLYMERRAARALASSFVAERELAATLEHSVSERTAELTEAQRVLQRMWALGQQVTVELHPERVLHRFIEAVVDIAQVDGGALGLLADSERVRIAAAIGLGSSRAGRVVPVTGSAMGRVITTGEPWREHDVALRPDLVGELAWSTGSRGPVRGIVVIPVHRGGRTIGALELASGAPRHFTDEELAQIGAMTDMFSVALANAELVEGLRQAEWRFRTLFRAAPDAVLTVDEAGCVREANDCVRDIFGLGAGELVGRTLLDLVKPDDRRRLDAALRAAFAGRAERLEVRCCCKGCPDGEQCQAGCDQTRLVALAVSRLPEADPPLLLLIGRDVTSERDMRARLMETERLAAVGELVAGVAHEVNNPLSSISAYAQLLLRDDGLSEGQRDSVEVIKSEALRASQVVKDLLSFARRSTPQSEPVHLNQVVERSLRLRNYQLASSSVAVALSLAPDLPQVTGDARQLQQVVLNLITNSIQAMSSIGGGTLRLTTRVEGRNVLLEVSDTGRGIPASARMRVFEPFYTTKQEGEGTGLGLSVSYGIVTAHGGSISITQSSPSGTTFVVALPAGAATAGAGPAVEPPLPGPRSALAGTRVLFVDDEASLRSGMEAFGRLRGFAVATAEDGETAMAAVQTRSFDAVVCDLRMPGMDGVSFHQALRRERPGLARRTIFITGDVLSGTARYTAAVRQPTLTKPFTFERLEEALVAVMRGRAVG